MMPLLSWPGLDDAPKGALTVVGNLLHKELHKDFGYLEFSCEESPDKYDRILWYDERDGRYREPIVAEVRAAGYHTWLEPTV